MSVRLGVVGCEYVSETYLRNLRLLAGIQIVAVSDQDMHRAQARAQAFDIPKALPLEQLLAEPEIEPVLKLTVPKAHAEIALAALEAGKSIYNENPLAVHREDARRMLDLACEKGSESAVQRIPFSVLACKRAASSLMPGQSAFLSERLRSWLAEVMRTGIPIRSFTIDLVVVRCSIWDPTISLEDPGRGADKCRDGGRLCGRGFGHNSHELRCVGSESAED